VSRAAYAGRGAEGAGWSAAYFRALVETTSDVIAVVDGPGTLTYVTPSVRDTLGYEPEQLVGSRVHPLLHPEARRGTVRGMRDALRWRGSAERVELRARHADGSWRVLEVTGRDLTGSAVGGVVLTCRDVTERRVAEEALWESETRLLHSQKVGAVGRLAGGVAHDFNNVLTAIKGLTQLVLLDVPAGDPMADELREIDRATDRAAALTRQLLSFTRREARRPRQVDLNAVVAGMAGMLRRLIRENVELVLAPAAAPLAVWADPGELEQVLLNLVVNARDAMPAGGRLLVETAHLPGPDGGRALLRVRDSGVGIPPEVRARIWEPFFTTKEAGKGTGLGLATVAGIVRRSGGTIEVESEPGSGTSFGILLPCLEPAAASEPASEEAAPAAGRETVLVVDDDDGVRRLTRMVLERYGYTVIAAAGGGQALRAAARHEGPLHLLVTDVVMPGIGGPELAEELASSFPELRVLYISGYPDEDLSEQRIPAGRMVRKPFSPQRLALAVREALDAPAAEPHPELP
jgi:two-component system cell cycle sensor histidine kinase/response regulator CckA